MIKFILTLIGWPGLSAFGINYEQNMKRRDLKMINVTTLAQEQVRLYFEGKDIVPIRIFLNSAGCGGPSLAMALDEKKRRMPCLPLMMWNTLWIRIC